MHKLISESSQVGIDPDEIRANPGALTEIKNDVLCDLMRTPHALERPGLTERGDAKHPRRRVCV